MKNLFTLLCVLILVLTGFSQPAIELDPFANGLSLPVGITHAGDTRLFVVEKNGTIQIVTESGQVLPTPFLDIDDRVNSVANERGLLGLAFHPDYANNGYFFVNYTNSSGATVIARFSRSQNDQNQADPNSELILLTISQPFSNHNGGGVVFGPDNMLYIGTGDGGSGGDPNNAGQTRTTLLGKMLRIDPNVEGDSPPFFIPEDNPFANDDFTLDEIWAIGLRNPWRYSFDRETGDLWIADVGQNAWEEVNLQMADSEGGENYGWRCYEGFETFNLSGDCNMITQTEPIWTYAHGGGFCRASITGGYVYRGAAYPALEGYYFYGDYCTGRIWSLISDGEGGWNNTELLDFNNSQITAFGEDVNGELYMAAIGQGRIYKLVQDCSGAVGPTIAVTDVTMLTATAGYTSYQWFLDGEAIDGATEATYIALTSGNYIVEAVNQDGCSTNSTAVSVVVTSVEEALDLEWVVISPNPFRENFQLEVSAIKTENFILKIRTIDGRLVYQSDEEIGTTFRKRIDLREQSPGIYLLSLEKDGVEIVRKLNKM